MLVSFQVQPAFEVEAVLVEADDDVEHHAGQQDVDRLGIPGTPPGMCDADGHGCLPVAPGLVAQAGFDMEDVFARGQVAEHHAVVIAGLEPGCVQPFHEVGIFHLRALGVVDDVECDVEGVFVVCQPDAVVVRTRDDAFVVLLLFITAVALDFGDDHGGDRAEVRDVSGRKAADTLLRAEV